MSEPNGNPNALPLHPPQPSSPSHPYSLATLAVHSDDPINSSTDVAPALHVSTTFRYPSDPAKLIPVSDLDIPSRLPGAPVQGDAHVYSRLTSPNTARLELMLTEILGAPSLTYASGLAAFHALLIHVNPKVLVMGAGYHGCHGVLDIFRRTSKDLKVVEFDPARATEAEELEGFERAWDAAGLGRGDLVHIETPTNPTGLALDIEAITSRAHARGARVSLDATFAPPPLLDPWKWGVDFVMHSGTKYIGGHSDMLCGVLGVGRHMDGWERDYWGLFGDRLHLGSVMGSLEGWLGVRSLRTLELRVKRQSGNAERLVAWLHGCVRGEEEEGTDDADAVRATVEKVVHASLQVGDFAWLRKQMPNGFGPVFCVWMKSEGMAKRLPAKLHLFHHATSLGGVEGLIEWRRMSDLTVDPRVLRVSVGVEDFEDLKHDFGQALRKLAAEEKGTNGA